MYEARLLKFSNEVTPAIRGEYTLLATRFIIEGPLLQRIYHDGDEDWIMQD
jgi:hypothetical protein